MTTWRITAPPGERWARSIERDFVGHAVMYGKEVVGKVVAARAHGEHLDVDVEHEFDLSTTRLTDFSFKVER